MKHKRIFTFLTALLIALALSGAPRLETQAQSGVTPVPDADYGETEWGRYVRVPMNENCANITATPVIVGDWLIYPSHEYMECQQNAGPYARVLFGYNLRDGQLYTLYEGAAGEAPLTYDAAGNTLYWTVTFGGTVLTFDPQTLELRQKMSVGITSDSGGAALDNLFYFGSVNSPGNACQNPLNPNCGGLFAINANGEVARQHNTDDGFRAWIGTSVTSDGEYLYWGSAAQTVGEKSGDETEYLYGCSVIKTDKDLNILATFDPGDLACYKLPFEGANMDSVSGEVVPDGKGVWVQYVRPNDERMMSALYRLDNDLNEVCRVEFPFEPQTQAVGFYTAPTVDAGGDAYIAVSVPDEGNIRRGLLLRVSPDCQTTTLAEAPGAFAHASPTLADDQYILFATDGKLQTLTLDGQIVKEYALASNARVLTSPVIQDGVIYVLQEDGTLNIIENSGLSGYGNAIWPRYRHDNAGSAILGEQVNAQGANTAPAAAPSTTVAESGNGPKGAFLAFHLEVSRGGRIKQLWPLLEQFMNLADQYGVKVTLQFSWPWADYVYKSNLLDTVYAWEAEGHEIALHHHGPTHAFFDGYTNAPDAIAGNMHVTNYDYLGDMGALMAFMAPLSQKGITSAGMSDEDTDWPAGVLYFATDSGDSPSKEDLLSRPVETAHNGYPVVEIYNAGYEIDHLGAESTNLADVEHALQTAAPDEYLGLVLNDNTVEAHFETIEPLFQLLQQYGVQVETVSALMGAR